MDSDKFRRQVLYRHATAASVAIGMETAVTYPLDTFKVVMQMSARPGEALPPRQAYAEASSLGALGVYRGAAVNMVGRAASLATRFGVYRVVSAFHEDGLQGIPMGTQPAFVAGAIAGSAESLVSAPFDLLRIRLQAATPLLPSIPSPSALKPALALPFTSSPNAPGGMIEAARMQGPTSLVGPDRSNKAMLFSDPGVHSGGQSAEFRTWERNPWGPRPSEPARSTLEALRGTVAAEGWTSLWRGWRATLGRDSLYGGVFFAGWVTMDELMREVEALSQGKDTRQLDRWRPAGPLESTIEAAVAATVAAVVSHPLDSAKTRTQGTVLPKHVAMERQLLRIEEGALWWQRLAGLRSWEHGIHWQGVGPRALHHCLGTVALVGTYHFILQMQIEPRL